MRCQECREALKHFVQTSEELDERRDLALHLAGCEDCARFLEDQSLWDQAVVQLLRREAPPDVRESILAAAPRSGVATGGPLVGTQTTLRWRDRIRFFWWAGTRDMSWRTWVEAIALAALVTLAVFALRWW